MYLQNFYHQNDKIISKYQSLVNIIGEGSKRSLVLFMLGEIWLIFLGTESEIVDSLGIPFHKIQRNRLYL